MRNVHTVCLIQNTELLFTEPKNVHFVRGTHIYRCYFGLHSIYCYLRFLRLECTGVETCDPLTPRLADAYSWLYVDAIRKVTRIHLPCSEKYARWKVDAATPISLGFRLISDYVWSHIVTASLQLQSRVSEKKHPVYR